MVVLYFHHRCLTIPPPVIYWLHQIKKEIKMFSTLEKTMFTIVATLAVVVLVLDLFVWRAM